MKKLLIISILCALSIFGKSQYLKPIKFSSGGGQMDTITLEPSTNYFKKHIGRPNRFPYWVAPISDSLSFDSPIRIDNPYSISFLHKDSIMTSPFWTPSNNGDLNFSFRGKDRIKQFYQTRNGTYEMYYGGTGITGAARSMGLFSYETGWVYNFTEMPDGLGNTHHRFGVGGSAQPGAKLDVFDDLPSTVRPTVIFRTANGLTNDASLLFAGLGPGGAAKQYNWTIGRNAANFHRFTIGNWTNLRSQNNNFFEIDTTGKVYIPRLKTTLAAPSTSGMIKTVVIDQAGQLSWTNSGAGQMDSIAIELDNTVKTYKNGALINTYVSIKDSLASKISKKIGNAKGDIITFSSNDMPEIQPVGSTNNLVLKSDNTTATGLKWEDALGIIQTVSNFTSSGTYTASSALVENARVIRFNQSFANVKFNLPALNTNYDKFIILENTGINPIQINDGVLTPADDIIYLQAGRSKVVHWNGTRWAKIDDDLRVLTVNNLTGNGSVGTTTLHGLKTIRFNQGTAGITYSLPIMPSDMDYTIVLENKGLASIQINDGVTNPSFDVLTLASNTVRHMHWNGTAWKKMF